MAENPTAGRQPTAAEWADPRVRRFRLRAQVDIVRRALPDVEVFSGAADDAGDMQYMYRRGVLMVRDSDLSRVREALGDRNDAVADSVIDGITAYHPPGGNVQAALSILDNRLGVGVATPDHVLYVTPAGCCPATEPLPPGGDAPDPGINPDQKCAGKGVRVSVVDTGLDTALVAKHDWLTGVTGDPEVVDPNDLGPYTGHGTFVAGVVRAMAPGAEVIVKGFLPNGGAVYESQIVSKLDSALNDMPDIISMSAGCTTRENLNLMGFEVFWENRLRHYKGTVLVVAAGNDGDRGPFWPATFPWTVSVGALDLAGGRAPFTNFGSWVDVYARGVDLVNAYPDGVYTYREPPNVGLTHTFTGLAKWSGTSFSTPLVAGLIAARMSVTGESAKDAASVLLRIAHAKARPLVGPVLEPGDGCPDEDGCCPECRCRCCAPKAERAEPG